MTNPWALVMTQVVGAAINLFETLDIRLIPGDKNCTEILDVEGVRCVLGLCVRRTSYAKARVSPQVSEWQEDTLIST